MRIILTLITFSLFMELSYGATKEIQPDTSSVQFKARGKPSFIAITGISKGLSGRLESKDQTLSGEVALDLRELKTGIDLRDEHMKDNYLEVGTYPKAKVILENVKVNEGENPFRAILQLHGVTKDISGKFNRQGNKLKAMFNINLSDFAIKVPSYQGITVAEKVDIEVDLSLSESERP